MFVRHFKKTFIIIALLFLVADFFPNFGRPYFRYTGSDPEHFVWNLGYPMVLFIFDKEHPPYIFHGPFVYGIVPLQLSVLSILCMVYLFIRRKKT